MVFSDSVKQRSDDKNTGSVLFIITVMVALVMIVAV